MSYDRPIQSRVGTEADRPEGWEVARWPEFLALAKRLGIDLDLPWTSVEIRIAVDESPVIRQEYLADNIDQQQKKHPVFETTTVHNEQYRTFKPSQGAKQ